MTVAVLLSINAVAFDPYIFDEAEVGQVELYDESSDLEYIPEVTSLGSSIDSEYGVGTSNTAIFSGLARKLPFGVNYVYWRASQYVYVFAYGRNLELSGSTFRADSVDTVTYNSRPGYDRQASYVHGSERNFSLSADDYLVWSNLGHYPTLDDGGDIYAKTTLAVLVGFGLFYLMSRIMQRCFC